MKKNIIITGASKGIGRAIALHLALQNYNIILFGRNKRRLSSLSTKLNKLGSNSIFFAGNVADKEFVDESIQIAKKKYKKIYGLINNAGVAVFKKFIDSSLEDFKLQIDANVYGVFNFCKAVINDMVNQNYGTIINIVSLAGKRGFEYGTTYAATKHAVMGFSKSLMQEVRKNNIRIVTICPGSVETDMIADSPLHARMKEALKPNDIAEVVSLTLKLPPRALISDIDIRPNNP